jgi:hypothetical protein
MRDIYKVFFRATEYIMGHFEGYVESLPVPEKNMEGIFNSCKKNNNKKHFILGAEEFPGPVNWTRPYFDCGR